MKRTCLVITGYFLAGAILTTAAAWIAALYVTFEDDDFQYRHTTKENYLWPTWHNSFADRVIIWRSERSQNQNALLSYRMAKHNLMFPWLNDKIQDINNSSGELPSWSVVSKWRELPISNNEIFIIEDVRGWPMRSFRSVLVLQNTDPPKFESRPRGLIIHEPSGTSYDLLKTSTIPLTPVWRGFVLDTLLFACLLLLTVHGTRRLKSLIRSVRGRCKLCGYDLRHNLNNGCPECGWNRD